MKRILLSVPFLVTGLLAASAVCLGSRHLVDQYRAGGTKATAPSGGGASSGSREGPQRAGEGRRPPGGRDAAAASKKLNSLMRVTDAAERTRSLLALLDTLQSSDFPALLEDLMKMGMADMTAAYPLVLEEWVRLDPAAAIAWAGANPNRLGSVVAIWSRNDPRAALDWIAAHSSQEGVGRLYVTTLEGIAKTDLSMATAEMEGHPDGADVREALRKVGFVVERGGRQALREWVDGMKNEEFQVRAINVIMTSKGPFNGADRVFWLENYPQIRHPDRIPAQYALYMQYAEGPALDHFAEMSAGELKDWAREGMTASIAKAGQPEKGLAFMDRFPEAVTDDLVSGWVHATAPANPALALSQMERFSSEETRGQAYAETLETWFQKEPEAARGWVRENQLPPDLKERFGSR